MTACIILQKTQKGRVRKRHKRLKKEESAKGTKATRPQDCIAKKGAFGSGLLSEGSEAMDGGETGIRTLVTR